MRRLPPRLQAGAAAAALILVSACAKEPVTSQAKKISTMYTATLVIATLVFIGVIGVMTWSMVRHRKKPGDDTLPPQIHGSTALEVVWTAIPTVIVLVLFVMSYSTLRAIDEKSANLGAVIEARGFQWSWQFDYGSGVVVVADPQKQGDVPTMVVPVGENIRIETRSDNVIHALYVPEFLFKRDIVPGRANSFEFKVLVPGFYKGQCAELCGTGHAVMTFAVKAVGRAEFDAWFADAKANAGLKPCELPAADTLVLASPKGELRFDKPCLTAPAGVDVPFTYTNGGGQPHNVAIFTKDPSAGGTPIVTGKIIPSGSDNFTVPGQQPGTYYFYCQVHPANMNGAYTVK